MTLLSELNISVNHSKAMQTKSGIGIVPFLLNNLHLGGFRQASSESDVASLSQRVASFRSSG